MNKSNINAKNQNHFDLFLLFKQSTIDHIQKAVANKETITKTQNKYTPNLSINEANTFMLIYL